MNIIDKAISNAVQRNPIPILCILSYSLLKDETAFNTPSASIGMMLILFIVLIVYKASQTTLQTPNSNTQKKKTSTRKVKIKILEGMQMNYSEKTEYK